MRGYELPPLPGERPRLGALRVLIRVSWIAAKILLTQPFFLAKELAGRAFGKPPLDSSGYEFGANLVGCVLFLLIAALLIDRWPFLGAIAAGYVVSHLLGIGVQVLLRK